MGYPAHIYFVDGLRKEHTVAEHSRACAKYASESSIAGLKHTAYLTGLLHDMGKNTDEYHEYIEKAAAGEKVLRGSVNHTFAVVCFIMERWYKDSSDDLMQKITCELIAGAAGSHHGLFDIYNPDGNDGIEYRMQKRDEINYKHARDRFLADCAGYEELDELFIFAKKEICAIIEQLKQCASTEQELLFYISLLQRILLSSVIEGDRRNTAEFKDDSLIQKQNSLSSGEWEELLENFETRLLKFDRKTKLDEFRCEISDECKEAAVSPEGIHILGAPTGSGKTLSTLRYNLAVTAYHGKRRIINAIPLLSVLEQNAKVIRDWIDNNDIILEHHSNIVREKNTTEELSNNELIIDSWEAPVVITTLVQLLNTMFSGKTSCIRRFHSLANSVITIDEVQSVPKKMLTLFNLALNFLSKICDTTIVLCSATQPSLEKTDHPIIYADPADLIRCDEKIREAFNRTEITDRRRLEGYTPQELSDFLYECQKQYGNVLIICNTKSQAKQIFENLVDEKNIKHFHLSTSMCMAHRKKVLDEINNSLNSREPSICVSTQLVEAGVDFSFACVVRISAGLDNIVQSAGRCNRNGEYADISPVFIVNFHGENLSNLKEIREAQAAAESVLLQYRRQPEMFKNSITSSEAVSAYYNKLFSDMPEKAQDYFVDEFGVSIYAMLSDNRLFKQRGKNGERILSHAFKTAGRSFTVFDNDTYDIIVPYADGNELITEFSSHAALNSLSCRKALLDKAANYTISLYEYEIKKLKETGGLITMYNGELFALKSGFYSEDTGFKVENNADSLSYFV